MLKAKKKKNTSTTGRKEGKEVPLFWKKRIVCLLTE